MYLNSLYKSESDKIPNISLAFVRPIKRTLKTIIYSLLAERDQNSLEGPAFSAGELKMVCLLTLISNA